MHGGGLELALVFLLAAVIAVPVFRKFGLGAVLGYLVAGVVLGPYGFRVIRDVEPVLGASEIGVVMLLFVIGLELSPSRLSVMRKPVFGAGGLQMLACGIALALLTQLRGVMFPAAIVVGLGLAFSSTAVGLQLLAERKALNTGHGRLAFAILLFQDLAAIPLACRDPAARRRAGRRRVVARGRQGDRRDRGRRDRWPPVAAPTVPHRRADRACPKSSPRARCSPCWARRGSCSWRG